MIDTRDTLDIFGDGSCVHFMKFNGTLTAEPPLSSAVTPNTHEYVTGKFGDAFHYLSGDDFLYFDNKIAWAETGFVFSVWVKFDDDSQRATFFTYAADERLEIFPDTNIVFFDVSGTRITVDAGVHNINLNDGEWHMFTLEVINSVWKLGIDGDYYATEPYTPRYFDPTWFYTRINYNVDQWRVFDRPLTSDELRILYYEGLLPLEFDYFDDTRAVPNAGASIFNDVRAIKSISESGSYFFSDVRESTKAQVRLFGDKREIGIGSKVLYFNDIREVIPEVYTSTIITRVYS